MTAGGTSSTHCDVGGDIELGIGFDLTAKVGCHTGSTTTWFRNEVLLAKSGDEGADDCFSHAYNSVRLVPGNESMVLYGYGLGV